MRRRPEDLFAKASTPLDRRPFWRRLVASLRFSLKPGKTWRRPLGYFGVTGKAEF